MSLRFKMIGAFVLGLGAAPALVDGGTTIWEHPDYRTAVQEIDEKNCAAAIPLLRKAVASDPEDGNAYDSLGDTHRQRGKMEETIGFYQKKHLAP